MCAAIRTVARLQLAVYNVFEDGLDATLAEILRQRYPDMLLPLLAESTRKCIEVRCPRISSRHFLPAPAELAVLTTLFDDTG